MEDDELATDEERSREHLRQNPAMEMGLWQDWVLVVCKRMNIAPPTGREWDALMRNWRHGKAPIDSVDELVAMRKTPNVPMRRARDQVAEARDAIAPRLDGRVKPL